MVDVRDWLIDLIKAHLGLFQPPEEHPEAVSGYPWCYEGWHDLLESLCVRIESPLQDGETIQILQLKEKFASLRCYWHGDVSSETTARISEAIALAQARSACTCEQCGAEGRLYNNGGLYTTRCAAHAKGAEVPPEPGQENVHLLRRRPGTSDVYCARYDREADRFVGLTLGSPGQEE